MDDVEEFERAHVGADEYLLDLGQPLVHLAVVLADIAFVLVCPVGGDTLLGYVVHALGAYLHFDPDAYLAHQGAVKRLVAVALRMPHPVADAAGLVLVNARDDGEDAVALAALGLLGVGGRGEDDADGIQVVHLLELHVLGAHLVPDGIRGLDALLYHEVESGLLEGRGDGRDELVYALVLVHDALVDAAGDLAESLGLLVFQPDVLHLGLHLVETQAVRQGDEDEHRLAEDLVPLVFGHELYGAAVVQTVRELDEHYAHVVVEGQEDALEVLRLEGIGAGILVVLLVLVVEHGLDLGEAVHERGYLVPEQVAYLVYGVVGVLHDVVEYGGADGLAAEAYALHHDARDGYRMQHIRLPGAPAHVLVRLVGELEGLLDERHLGVRPAAPGRQRLQLLILTVDEVVVLLRKLRKTHWISSSSSSSFISSLSLSHMGVKSLRRPSGM